MRIAMKKAGVLFPAFLVRRQPRRFHGALHSVEKLRRRFIKRGALCTGIAGKHMACIVAFLPTP